MSDPVNLNHALEVAVKAIEDEIAALREAGGISTHFTGCEKSHPRCAAVKRLNDALSTLRQQVTIEQENK